MDSYTSPRISSEIFDCALPFTFDQYNYCAFNCLYCFAYAQKTLNPTLTTAYEALPLKTVSAKHIENILTGESNSVLDTFYHEQFVKRRCPLHWGGLADPFCPLEARHRQGLKIIKTLDKYNYPTFFSTKGYLMMNDEYFSIFKNNPDNWAFQFSITGTDEAKVKEIERGVVSPNARFSAMKKLSEIGVKVLLRFRPFILGLSDETMEDTIEKAHDAGAEAVTSEFFCYDARGTDIIKQRYRKMSEALGFDLEDLYKRTSRGSGYLRTNRNLKEGYFLKLRDLAHKYGMIFSISDPDFKELNDTACCCGLSKDGSKFENYCDGQWTGALLHAKEHGKVGFDYFDGKIDWMKAILTGKTDPGRMFSSVRKAKDEWDALEEVSEYLPLYTWIRNVWNNPNISHSPYQMFNGKLYKIGVDENKDVIYKYRRDDYE